MVTRLFWNTHTRRIILYLFRFSPIKKKRILFLCWNGTKYGCNPKIIADKLLETEDGFEVSFAFYQPALFSASLTKGTKALLLGSLEYYYFLATSHFIVSNVHINPSHFPYKKSSQIYIFTGHGSFGIKKIEFDSANSLSEEYKKAAAIDTSRIDLFLSNAVFRTKVLRSAYRYKGEVLECGIPRNDVFFINSQYQVGETKREFIEKHKLADIDNIKFLLYTPTFRTNGGHELYGFDFNRVGLTLKKCFGGEWYFLISSHPNMIDIYRDVYDFSNEHLIDVAHEDLQGLMLFSDILISDYSSAEMDFMLLKKPVFQLCKDYEKYDRGYYIDPHDLPFPYAENDDELVSCIEKFEREVYLEALETFDRDCVGIRDKGIATSSVIDWIKKHI